jgi:hypothetical protein
MHSEIYILQSSPLVSQNVITFGDSAIKEVTNLSEVTKVAPNTVRLVSLKRKFGYRHTKTM